MCIVDAPYQDNPSICTWVADTSQTCEILFHANTNVTVVQITKDGEFKAASTGELHSDEFFC